MSKAITLALMFLVVITGVAVWFARESSDSVDVDRLNRANVVTFNKDIAPILFENCVVCHRPGESAPFHLLGYQDVKNRVEQIVEVTQSGFMPPWLPESGELKLFGERRLNARQIEMIRQWVAEGAVEGDPADLPSLPQWTDGWQLGQPDIVVTLPDPFTLPGEGTDVYHNFVLSVPVSEMRYVKAVELQPGNKRIVHHAIMNVDRMGMIRQLDEKEPGPGFGGMVVEYGEAPDGVFLGWTPGKVAKADGSSIAWRLYPGTDLLLQLHMVPTGKPELIQPRVGLFFDKAPTTRNPAFLLKMSSLTASEIPAGVKGFEVTSEFVLPVPVQVAFVYPHAHYLGKEIEGVATLPDGTRQQLLHIKQWDFNWQDSYYFTDRPWLPKGTVLTMKWTYDNSADNVRNPSQPPQRVVFGNKTTDEMAHLYFQFLLRDEREVDLLKIAKMQKVLEIFPRDWTAHTILGTSLIHLGKFAEAVHHLRRALEANPDFAKAHYNLGLALESQQKSDEAIQHYHEAARLDPNQPMIYTRLAGVLQADGRLDELIQFLSGLIELNADNAALYYRRGITYGKLRKYEAAMDDFNQAIKIAPDFVDAYNGRGDVDRALGHAELALSAYDQAVNLRPEFTAALFRRSNVATEIGKYEKAFHDLTRLIKLSPQDWRVHNNLASLLAICPEPKYRDGKQAQLHAKRACELTQWKHWGTLDTLAAACAEAGQFPQAIEWQVKALELAPSSAQADLRSRLELYQAGKPYREPLRK